MILASIDFSELQMNRKFSAACQRAEDGWKIVSLTEMCTFNKQK